MLRRLEVALIGGTVLFLFLTDAPIGIWVMFGLFIAYHLFNSHIRWRFRPIATLEVDSHTVEYRYHRENDGGQTIFIGESHSYPHSYFLLSKAPIDQDMTIVGIHMAQSETTVYEATLTLEEESYDILMDGGFGRCPCWRETPCWTGQVYVSNFIYDLDDHQLGGQIVFVDTGGKPKRKQRKFSLKKIKLPSWKILPVPSPRPS